MFMSYKQYFMRMSENSISL
uniref:Uncharacterized protein n=1 Tax=Anguilla anguilla TaxID=7936 RepID=A0A0E9QT13_ANGAN